MRVKSVVMLCAAVVGAASVSRAQTTYRRVEVDPAGHLRVTTAAGVTISPPLDSDQVGVADPAVSPDGRSVGWLALYPNCCTTYPIPLTLIVRSNGRERRFAGIGLPISQWAFLAGGRRVALSQAPLHGLVSTHYALYDIASGRLVGTYDQAPDTGSASTPLDGSAGADVPAWVRKAFAPSAYSPRRRPHARRLTRDIESDSGHAACANSTTFATRRVDCSRGTSIASSS
jgi:hypothetical protein